MLLSMITNKIKIKIKLKIPKGYPCICPEGIYLILCHIFFYFKNHYFKHPFEKSKKVKF